MGVGVKEDEILLEGFARYQRARNLSPSTTRREALILRACLRETGASLATMTPQLLSAWLESRDLSARTRSSYLSYFSAFYSWAVRDRRLKEDPTRAIIRPKLPRSLPRPMPDVHLQLALQMARGRVRCWLCLGAFEGLRVSEMARLTGEDVQIHADPPVLRINHAKGDRDRVVPLHPTTASVLQDWGIPHHGPVFPGASPKVAIRPATITKHVSRFLRSLGISDTAHSLRHWFGSEMYRDSHDLRMVQEMLGHSNVSTTQGYTAFSPGAATRIVQQLGERLGNLNGNGPTAAGLLWAISAVAGCHLVVNGLGFHLAPLAT